ncbi:hypothetical protein PIGHUM_01404 [Pigmentiphaga humi]|uniref:Thioredoxin domain-containing protein n=1 Tax=Pigmentiphaga humi TaxID=2478468 RepID=A0A3P4AZY4_9BURK|nr:hypothetical protein [Pigmentiphaga humi]VCU69342.1 hypothetical protein PIGHUM_01404 [Pigmentiphaga humi]
MSDISARPVDARRPAPRRRSLFALYAVLLVCAAPLVAAALVYFLDWRPDGAGTNYGSLVDPQRPVPPAEQLQLTDLDGSAFDLRSLTGKWVMVSADSGDCGDECAKKLFIMRQTHASTGKNVGRIERVWLILDDEPVPTIVIRAYEGAHMVRANAEQVARFLALPDGTRPSAQALKQHIWLIDPRNNQMLRFPENPDPLRLRDDIGKLLHASRIG